MLMWVCGWFPIQSHCPVAATCLRLLLSQENAFSELMSWTKSEMGKKFSSSHQKSHLIFQNLFWGIKYFIWMYGFSFVKYWKAICGSRCCPHWESPVTFLMLRLWLASRNVFLFLIYGNILIFSLMYFWNYVSSPSSFSLEVPHFSPSQTINYICIDIQIMLSSVCHCMGKYGVHKLITEKIYHSFGFGKWRMNNFIFLVNLVSFLV